MKVLVSAIACNPFQGSESYFGWAAITCLGKDHELLVITSGRNRLDLEKAQAQGLVPPGVRFFYAGKFKPWHPNRLLARIQSWKEYIHFAGDLSCAETHSSRFLPSKRMMASEGGAPLVAPGVTTGGTGSQTSVSCGLAAGAVVDSCPLAL